MRYHCVLKSESKENIYFSGKNSCETGLNVKQYLTYVAKTTPLIASYLTNKDFYVKIQVGELRAFNSEIKYYNLLEKYNITPKLLHYFIIDHYKCFEIYEGEEDEECDNYYITALVMEYRGNSIADIFLDDTYSGPGAPSQNLLENNKLFEMFFPSDKVPQSIIDQIKIILTKFKKIGIIHDDTHAGNFLVDSAGNVTVVDFELMSYYI